MRDSFWAKRIGLFQERVLQALKRSHPTRCNNAGCSECLRVFLKADLGPQLGKRHARAPSEYGIPGAKRKKLEHSEAQEAGSDDVADMEIDDDVFTPQSLSAPPLVPVKQETVQVRRVVAPIQHVTPRHARRRRSDVWKWLQDRLRAVPFRRLPLSYTQLTNFAMKCSTRCYNTRIREHAR